MKIFVSFFSLEQKSASSLTIFAAVAGVLAVVVFALVVALVILYKRYRNPQTASRVVYTKTSSDDNKQLVWGDLNWWVYFAAPCIDVISDIASLC